jgi:hypothetical protein
MSWRIHEHILRGEIDNRTRGRVTGRIWLAGVAEPLVLDLAGDCMPDLAGCLLRFENPAAIPLVTPPPAARQRGDVIEITAARRLHVFDVPIEDAFATLRAGGKPPEHVANAFHLEWHSDLSGDFVIESADYRLKISEPAWRFTADEIAELERRAAEREQHPADFESDEKWDEFRCEQLLRESDARTEKYGKLLEKYMDHPDREGIVAREMGWATIEEALRNEPEESSDANAGDAPPIDDDIFSDEDEDEEEDEDEDEAKGGASDQDEVDEDEDDNLLAEMNDYEDPEPDPAREGIDWVHDHEERVVHPIVKRSKTALYALFAELRERGLERNEDPALEAFVGPFTALSPKLAGALNAIAQGWHLPDPGFTIALLKRALVIHNEAIEGAAKLVGTHYLPPERLEWYRSELFGVREDILALITRLRGSIE